jgi:hypothetical protein
VIDRVLGLGLGLAEEWRFCRGLGLGLGQRIRSSVCLGLGKLLSCQSSASAVFEEKTEDLTGDFLKIFPV